MADWILSCESTVDMPYSWAKERDIPILFYSYMVDGQVFEDDMDRTSGSAERFFSKMKMGMLPSTSQINQAQYDDYFQSLPKDKDILHIVFGSSMTGSINNARLSAAEFNEKGGRKITILDSTCSSSGYGLLCDMAADDRDAGMTLEETASHMEKVCHNIQHQLFATDLKFYARTGRMNALVSVIGTLLNILPIMRLDYPGKIVAYSKVRGKKAAIAESLKEFEKHAVGGLKHTGKVCISHSNMLDDAQTLRQKLEELCPQLAGKIRICNIGPVIGAHCGPGTVGLYFLGDERFKSK